MEQARIEIVKTGNHPRDLDPLVDSISKDHNPFNEAHGKRLAWAPDIKKNGRRIAYFSGCTAAYRENEIAQSTVQLLGSLNHSVVLLKEEWCCGSPLFRTGFVDQALEVARHNIDIFNELEAEAIIVTCPGCYRALTVDYPEYGLNFNKPIHHISEFLEGRLDDLPTGTFVGSITYHDPCHLGRHMDVYEAPRRVIQRITGKAVTEMERNRENAACCGNGAGLRTLFTEKAKKIGAERVRHAEDVGANMLVTACPFCKNMLKSQAGENVDVIDLPELVEKAMMDRKRHK